MRRNLALGLITFFALGVFIFSIPNVKAEIAVYDSDGQFLGVNLDSSEGTSLFIPSLCKWITLDANFSNLTIYCKGNVVYTTSTCSGTKFVLNAGSIISPEKGLNRYYAPKWPISQHVSPAKLYHSWYDGKCYNFSLDTPPEYIYDCEEVDLPFRLPGKYPFRYKYNQSFTIGGKDLCPPIPENSSTAISLQGYEEERHPKDAVIPIN